VLSQSVVRAECLVDELAFVPMLLDWIREVIRRSGEEKKYEAQLH